MLRQQSKEFINYVLSSVGLRLVSSSTALSWNHFFRNLESVSLSPKTVFDIGVAYGTPDLYKAFPKAKFYLIAPAQEALPIMNENAAQYHAKIFNVALGDTAGELEIKVRPRISDSSTFDDFDTVDILRRYTVPVERFDELFTEIPRPALVKIDVQGAEMSVLHGMGGVFDQIDAIIIEPSLISTLVGSPEVFEVYRFLDDVGFCLYDVMSTARRPLDGALAQVDLAFVRKTSPLRKDRRWQAG